MRNYWKQKENSNNGIDAIIRKGRINERVPEAILPQKKRINFYMMMEKTEYYP